MGSVSSNQQGDDASNMQLVSGEARAIQLDEVDVKKEVFSPLKQLTGWNLKDIRIIYDTFQRRNKNSIAFIDKNIFCKIIPLSRSNSSYIFDHFSRAKQFISIYEFLSTLVMTSFSHYISKIHFLYVLFDLDCSGNISLNELLIIFKSVVLGYCKLTNCTIPNYTKLEKFAKLVFLKSDIQADNSLELKEIIEWCEGNQKAMEIFKKFEPKYLITEEFKIFQLFRPYPEEDSKFMLNQIDQANKNEHFFTDLDKVVNGIGVQKSYLQQTDAFKIYKETRERAFTQCMQARKTFSSQQSFGRDTKNINQFNKQDLQSSNDKYKSFYQSMQSQKSKLYDNKRHQTQQTLEPIDERKNKMQNMNASKFFKNLRTQESQDNNDQDDAINFALNSHLKTFKKQQTQKISEFEDEQNENNSDKKEDNAEDKNQVLGSATTRILTETGMITRVEISKLKEFYDFIFILKQIDKIRIMQQEQRIQKEKQEEVEKMQELQRLNEQQKQQNLMLQSMGKLNFQSSNSPNISSQYTLQKDLQDYQLSQIKKELNAEIEKREKLRLQREQIQNQKIEREKQQRIQEFLQIFLGQNKQNEKLIHERKEEFITKIVKRHQNQYQTFNLTFQDLVKQIYPVITRQPLVVQNQYFDIIDQWIQPPKPRAESTIIITKGQALTKQEIYKMKQYFDVLSEKDKTIKINKFQKAMQDKKHMKRVTQSLFQYLDTQQTSEVTFQQLLLGVHPSLPKQSLEVIDKWVTTYQKTFDMQSKDMKVEESKQQEEIQRTVSSSKFIKKRKRILPSSTMIRLNEIFSNIDEEKKGYLTIHNLIHKFNYGFTVKEIETLFSKHDVNKDGKMEIQDFTRMILPPDYIIENQKDEDNDL